jgi:site-specific recombinase XerD
MKKSKLNPNNEKIKDKYESFLRNSRIYKLSLETVKHKILSVRKYEELVKYESFESFNADKGISFYETLKNSDIEISTLIKHLTNLKEFLSWHFSNHKVSNKKHLLAALQTLEPREEDKRLANRLTYVEYPSIEQFNKLIDFPEKTIEDKRDKAILTFLFTSCARISAVATTKLKSFNVDTMIYQQDPLEGIHTKRSKHIISKLLQFDKRYYEIIRDWVKYLKEEMNFSENEPLFPEIRNGVVTKKGLNGEQAYNKLIEKRCAVAKLPKYHPHSFRHAGINEALNRIKTGKQIKALSQNVGHESISTILEKYANMKPEEYMHILGNLCQEAERNLGSENFSNEELLQELLRRENVEKKF